MLRLNLGSGNVRVPGFTNVDLYDETADYRVDIATLPFDNDSVEEIICNQVIEHIHYAETKAVLAEMYRVLKPGSHAHIETPDIQVIAQRIVDTGEITENTIINLVGQYYRPHDQDRYTDWYHHAGSIHRNPWNFTRLKREAEIAGFMVERLPITEMVYKFKENLAVKLTKGENYDNV